MKTAIRLVIGLLMALTGLLSASDEAPRWGGLGDDDQLKFKFQQSREVALVCVFDTEVHRIPHSNPKITSPFADIVFHADVSSPASEAKLAPGFVLSLNEHDLPGNTALRGVYVVTGKGEVNLPYLGKVAVTGLNKAEAINKITDAWLATGIQVK